MKVLFAGFLMIALVLALYVYQHGLVLLQGLAPVF